MIVAFFVIPQLAAQAAARHRMLWVARHRKQLAVLYGIDHGTGIGTVVRTAPVKSLDLIVALLLQKAGVPWVIHDRALLVSYEFSSTLYSLV